MVKVVLWGNLKDRVGAPAEIDMDQKTIRGVFDQLIADHPSLEPDLESAVSVAVDGQIFRDAWFVELAPDAEVFILPKLQGG